MSVAEKSLQFILFDFDGTLVDSETAFAKYDGQLLNDILIKAGSDYNLSYEEARALAGFPGPEKLSQISKKAGSDLSDYKEEFKKQRKAGRPTLMADMNVQPQKGVLDFLEKYASQSGLASNKERGKLLNDLKHLSLDHYFEDRVWGAEGVFTKKPSPEMLLHVAEFLDIQPQEIGYVGDLPTDMEAAKAAGMIAFGFQDLNVGTTENALILQESGADRIIEDMKDLTLYIT